jgi:hypothetical protein
MRLLSVTVLLARLCAAQVASSNVSLSNGVQIRVGTGAPTALKPDMQPASGESFYRIFRDQNGLVVFAYELSVERTPDGQQFRIRAMPAGNEFAAKFPDADGGKPVPTLSKSMESPLLDSGGSFTIDIPTDPALNEKLTDVAQVRMANRGGPVGSKEAQSSPQIRFVSLKVRLNGALASPVGAGTSVIGSYAMFFLPGKGGYFFAAQHTDRKDFVQAGVVDGKHLRFTVDNETYDCESEVPILTQSERGEVWVLHDVNYKPQGNWTKNNPGTATRAEFFTAASDSLNWWLP